MAAHRPRLSLLRTIKTRPWARDRVHDLFGQGRLERETETATFRLFLDVYDAPIGRETWRNILRKEVIQPQVPLRLPCYDFTPVADPTVVTCLLAVSTVPSGKANSHGVTGGVYKARERIHRGMLIRDY